MGICNSRSWAKKAIKQQPSSTVKELCREFSEAEIKSATNNFDPSSIIGEGEFGMVYRGYVKESSTQVAVTRCKNISKVRLSEFKDEAVLLSQLDHPNILPLVGYWRNRKELFTVYNYMPNGSLHDHLFNEYLDDKQDGHWGSLKEYAQEIIDPSLESEITPSCWKAFIDITERCLLPIGRDRPNIAQIQLQLNRALQLQEE